MSLPISVVRGCLAASITERASDMAPTPGCQAGESRVMNRRGCGRPATHRVYADLGAYDLCAECADRHGADPKMVPLSEVGPDGFPVRPLV